MTVRLYDPNLHWIRGLRRIQRYSGKIKKFPALWTASFQAARRFARVAADFCARDGVRFANFAARFGVEDEVRFVEGAAGCGAAGKGSGAGASARFVEGTGG